MIRFALISLVVIAFGGAMVQNSGPKLEKRSLPRHQEWNFDRDAIGKLPKGWTVASTHPGKALAEWNVTADPSAPSRANVLTLTKTENTGGTFNLAILREVDYRDLQVNVQLRANTGKEDQGGGLVWRYKDPDNYYICRLNPLERNFRAYVVEKGRRRQFSSANVEATTGHWYALRVTMVGDGITCYVDTKKLLEAQDHTFREPGMIGLWTKADAASSFDDLRVLEIREESKPHPAIKNPRAGTKQKEKDKDDDDDDD